MAERPERPLLLDDELAALRSVGVERSFDAGDRLVSIGDRSSEVFYLVDGAVKILVVAANGSESVFGLRSRGEFVGEMSTLNNTRRSADVVAVEPTRAVMATASRFIAFLQDHPAVAIAMLRMQSRRLDEMTLRSTLGSRSVKARVAQRLLELSESSPAGEVALTQGDLAQFVDASREWTSKALGELRRAGSIATARGRVTVIDRTALHAATLD